jgi:hypothetical protein
MTQVIVGAGIAGLLAANMLRDLKPMVCEKQSNLPNNHSAVLRFRSPLVGEVLGAPFKRVKMIKATLPWKNPVADALVYACKCTGTYRSDRSLPSSPVEAERWIAPPDLLSRMAEGVDIRFNKDYSFSDLCFKTHGKVISTIPMPFLMEKLNYPGPRPEFKFQNGVNIRAKVSDCDAYVTLYIPDPQFSFSRITLTGDELILEFPGWNKEDLVDKVRSYLSVAAPMIGIGKAEIKDVQVIPQKYAKIEPIDEEMRRTFIFWASTLQGRAFSLGRFSCWRPGLMTEDLVKDVRLIETWIKSGRMQGMDQTLHSVTSWR